MGTIAAVAVGIVIGLAIAFGLVVLVIMGGSPEDRMPAEDDVAGWTSYPPLPPKIKMEVDHETDIT